MLRFTLTLLILLFTIIGNAQSNSLEVFNGEFRHGNFSTDLIIEIDRSNSPAQIFFSSPEQNAFRIPAQNAQIDQDSIKFELQSDFHLYSFQGAIKENSLKLNLNVDNSDFPFTLNRSSADKKEIRSRDIRFRNGELLLYGTMYFPEKPNGKALYLVTSSGNQDRSASRAEAQFFAKQGFITLHTDKRGTGLSDGNWQAASIPELCDDDLRAITYLAETNSLKYSEIGIKGSSQGGAKIPYILSKMPDLGFGIVISCPASTLLDSDLNYWKNRNSKNLSEGDLTKAENLQKSVFLFIAGEKSMEELNKELSNAKDETWREYVWVPELESVETDRKLAYSPVPYFNKIDQPLLVVQGSSDEIIPSNSLEAIKDLTESDNDRSSFVFLKEADHAMMFKGNSDFAYWPSLHPDYRKSMISWLNQLGISSN